MIYFWKLLVCLWNLPAFYETVHSKLSFHKEMIDQLNREADIDA